MSALKSWRELLATPLPEPPKEGQDDVSQEHASDKSDNRTNQDSLRVDLSETVIGQIEETSDKSPVQPSNVRSGVRSRLVRTGPNTWVLAEWSLALCVMCDELLAPGDLIACPEHRLRIEAVS